MIKLKDLLKEDKISVSKDEMAKLHKDGKLEKDGHVISFTEGGPGSGPQGEDNPFDKEPSDDDLAAIEKEFESVNEVNFEKIKLPAMVDRFLKKFVQSMKDANLNRMKRAAILYKVINASGISTQQLMADIQKIKRELK